MAKKTKRNRADVKTTKAGGPEKTAKTKKADPSETTKVAVMVAKGEL
jgi:hypothetical protein